MLAIADRLRYGLDEKTQTDAIVAGLVKAGFVAPDREAEARETVAGAIRQDGQHERRGYCGLSAIALVYRSLRERNLVPEDA